MLFEDISIQKVLEYSDLFDNRANFDIRNTLQKYNRRLLVDSAIILVNNYNNATVPGEISFFSDTRCNSYKRLMNRLDEFRKKNPLFGEKLYFCTEKTSVELLRDIFEIPCSEYLDEGVKDELEYDLFKVILAINEDIMSICGGNEQSIEAQIYVNQFANNDLNAQHELCFRAQLLYAKYLFSFMEQSPEMLPILNDFYEEYGIEHWAEYILTLSGIYFIKVGSMDQQRLGRKTLVMSKEKKSSLRRSIVEKISIGIDDHFGLDNEDYKIFRAKPLIRIDEDTYYVGNNQMLCERMYNSLFFELKAIWDKHYPKKEFFSFYNKQFVEAYLFDNIIDRCVNKNKCVTAPNIDPVDYTKNLIEETNQPDFYSRYRYEITLFECKGTKLNSRLKSKADVDDIIKSLRERFLIKKDGAEVGIGQLLNHIDCIEDDDFKWDKEIPDQVTYYPVLALENDGLNKRGLLGLTNEWFLEGRKQKNLMYTACRPLIVINISTLFFYCDTFRRRGFRFLFDDFFNSNVRMNEDGTYIVKKGASFDIYMTKYAVSPDTKTLISNLLDQMKSILSQQPLKS